jgi:hypothetical protein
MVQNKCNITLHNYTFLRKIWPIQLAFRFLISCRIFLCSPTLSNTSSFLTWSVQMIFSILLQHHISKLSTSVSIILKKLIVQQILKHVLKIAYLKISKNYKISIKIMWKANGLLTRMCVDYVLLYEISCGVYRQLRDVLICICVPVFFYGVYLKKKAVSSETLYCVCVLKY